MPNFRVNSGGNTADSIKDDFRAVQVAAAALVDALRAAQCSALHGRNYQTVPDAQQAQDADLKDCREFIRQATVAAYWASSGFAEAHRQKPRG